MVKQSHNRLNLMGQRFGRLIAKKFAGIEARRRESLWECLCDCGNIVVKCAGDLRSGNTKSCGCYHKIRTRQLFSIPDEDIRVNRVFYDYRKRAKNKGLKFELTKNQFAIFMDALCYYCGAEPSNSFVQHGRQLLAYQGIDRLDNSKGYTPENCVPCCIICNKMKKAMNHDEFIEHIQKIAESVKIPQEFDSLAEVL